MMRSTLWIILTIIAAAIALFLNGVTAASLVVIQSFFLYALWNIWIMNQTFRIVNKARNDENIVDSIKSSSLSILWDEYEKTLVHNIDGQKKTNIPSSEFFSISKITRRNNLNLRIVDAASGTLVGLGLLGTFLGLTLGVRNFDTANVQNIQSSIQSLLDGMSTAFLTSLLGMGFSIIYTLIEKRNRNRLLGSITDFTDRLDREFYMDDQQLILYLLQPQLSFVNEAGERIPISLAIRDILKENEQQSKALKSFSTDLAMQLNDGFDEILSRQMQARIIPLMENVDATTKTIIEHIDRTAEIMASPATDLIDTVVDELKRSMESLINEFRDNISNSASNELQHLVASLSEATTSMTLFPKNLEDVTTALQLTMEDVKDSIAEISNSSANANAEAMRQMQEQVSFATTSLSNVMEEVKDVVASMTHTSEQSSQNMVDKMTAASEQMGTFLNGIMSNISTSVKASMQSIVDDLNDKQSDLMALQESTINSVLTEVKNAITSITQASEQNSESIANKMTAATEQTGSFLNGIMANISTSVKTSMQSITEDIKERQTELMLLQENTMTETEKLLQRFNIGLERLEKMNEHITGTMNTFQLAQAQINNTTAHLQTISSKMRLATESFQETQDEYADKMNDLQESTERAIESVTNILQESGSLSKEYAEKFETIRAGIGGIFTQIQRGLTEYSQYVQSSTQKYLEDYSRELTKATNALSGAIQQQNEVTETIADELQKFRRR